MQILGAWPSLPQPPGGKKVRSGHRGAPPPEPSPLPWHSPPPVGERPGGEQQAGRAGEGWRGAWRDCAGRAAEPRHRGPFPLVTSRSPVARPPGALDIMKQLCLCAAASFAVGPGEGAGERGGRGPFLPSPSRPSPSPDRAEPRPSTPRPAKDDQGGGRGRDRDWGGWMVHLGGQF